MVEGKNPFVVLNELGTHFMQYRSWGRWDDVAQKREVCGKKSEKNFQDDHDWYREEKKGWREKNKNFHPRRVVFGLPHNYHAKVDKHKINADKHERRASPLMFHVHQLDESSYLGISLVLPAEFLPPGEKIQAGTKLVKQNADYTVIKDFLDGNPNLSGKPPKSIKDRFKDVANKTIWPAKTGDLV